MRTEYARPLPPPKTTTTQVFLITRDPSPKAAVSLAFHRRNDRKHQVHIYQPPGYEQSERVSPRLASRGGGRAVPPIFMEGADLKGEVGHRCGQG